MFGQIARRGDVEPQDLTSLRELLERYLWIIEIRVDYPGIEMVVRGMVRPNETAGSAAALRQSFLESFETVMALLAELGARHSRHPDFRIGGRAQHRISGTDDFVRMTCDVEFHLLGA
jgi:hypothetical protein